MILAIVISAVALICYGLLLYAVVRHGLHSRVNRLFAAYLVPMLFWQVAALAVSLSTSASTALVWYRLMTTVALAQFTLYFLFTQAFLNIRGQRWVTVAGVVSWCVGLVMFITASPLYIPSIHRHGTTGLLVPDFGLALAALAIISYFILACSVYNLLRGFGSAKSEIERIRLKYLLVGMGFVIAGIFANFSPLLQGYPIDVAANIINALLIAFAILRYQLLDVTVVVRKGMLYSVPTAILGAGYFLIVFLAVDLFHLVLGYQVLLLSLVLAAITAVAVQPLWSRMQSWIDKLFFREKYDTTLMLQRLSHTAASVLDLEKLAHLILDELEGTMHVQRVGLFLMHLESSEFHLAAERGLGRDRPVRLRKDHPLLAWLSWHGRLLTRQRLDVVPQFKALWAQEREDLDKIGAELFVPLRVREGLIGVLVLGPKRSEAPYSQDEERILTTLANQTAVAIQNAWLFSLEQRKAEESVALLEIAKAVSSTLDLTQMLEIVARRTAEICGVERCSILLLSGEGDRLMPLMSQFADGSRDLEMWQTFKQRTYMESLDRVPLIRRLLAGGEPAVLDSGLIAQLPESWIKPFGIQSLLAVPLVSRDQTIGLMALDHTKEGLGFSDEQISLAATIGTQVSIAIENARLYEEAVEEKERTETIVEQAFAGIMVVDPQARIVTVNPEVEAITGFTGEELVGRHLSEVLGAEVLGEESILAQVRETGERVTTAEATLQSKDGTRDIFLGVIPIREGFLLNFTDISRFKEVDRLKSSIVANVSHELRAPLASIKAYTELLLDNLEGEDRVLRHRFLSIIDQEADWLTELINDLLDLSRLESEKYAAHMELVSLNDVIDTVMPLLDHQVRRVGVAIHLDVPTDLPLIMGDKELLTVLVKNLLSNATKFSADGDCVEVIARQEPECLVLSIVDEGIGIPPEDLPRLFTKFYRSSVSRQAGIRGTGLGLVLAKEAAELHGGTIELESELGVGTRVTLTLPISHQAMAEMRREREKAYG